MKKMLRFVLLLIVALGLAGGRGVKVRQLANSKILIKDETIFTLKAGTGRGAWRTALWRQDH